MRTRISFNDCPWCWCEQHALRISLTIAAIAIIFLCAGAIFGQTAQIWPPYNAAMSTAQLQARYDALQSEIERTNDYRALAALNAEQKPIADELQARDMAQFRANTEALQAGFAMLAQEKPKPHHHWWRKDRPCSKSSHP